ncbi:PLAT/LH2 domain-containing protein [Streptomyces himalayensis]|uniref:PLAT domain-containing protein n=1 Tax=Streptomyces himalayensis subsp. himalayensis TaxID=2756131 RepID=A0A7W0DK54_9ACTN|nr:PLAT/LH2 domain-containing protein [Streptomyces himalayensis]MBA2946589.1 hypothetical protein [Streptomyces himalayensis subsp. himalayensis]
MKIRTAAAAIATLAALSAPAIPSASAATAKSGLTGDLTVSTCNVSGAGTNDHVYVRLHSYNGLSTQWQLLDHPDYNDFERGARDVYDLADPPVGWDLTYSVEFRKFGPDGNDGDDDWCLRSIRLGPNGGWWGPKPLKAPSFPFGGPRYRWLGNDQIPGAHTQPDGKVYVYSYPTLTVYWPYLR